MRAAHRLLALGLALMLAATALAQEAGDDTVVDLDTGIFTVRTVADACAADAAAADDLEPGDNATLCFTFDPAAAVNVTRNVTVALSPPPALNFSAPNVTFAVPAGSEDPVREGVAFTVASDAARETFTVTIVVTVTGANGTILDDGDGLHAVTLAAATPPADDGDGPPSTVLLLVLAVLIVGLGAGGFVALRRRRQVKVQPRSQALRQMEAERALERVKKPEERQKVEAEIKAAEEERALSREAQILQAKIDDTRGGLERLQERFEAGQLTQHQYDRMRQRREEQLEELMRELDDVSGR